jgi:hypothetical protein
MKTYQSVYTLHGQHQVVVTHSLPDILGSKGQFKVHSVECETCALSALAVAAAGFAAEHQVRRLNVDGAELEFSRSFAAEVAA